jgi:ketosteroid isomerase-like protein
MIMTKQTLAELEQLNAAIFQAYNAHDVSAVLEHLTDDIEWVEPEGTYVGKTEVGAALEELFDAFPDAAWPTDDVMVMTASDHKTLAITWTMKGPKPASTTGCRRPASTWSSAASRWSR